MKKTAEVKIKLENSKLVEAFQKIDFSTPEGEISREDSCEIVGEDVVIIPSAGDHETGSSKVKLNNIVDYTWEERFYTGQLLAVHMDGDYIAYGIRAVKTETYVRVVNRKMNYRSLIKGVEGEVQDITFAHVPREVILACMDLKGNLFVYKVLEDEQKQQLECHLLLHILPDTSYISQPEDFFRAIWCPFIPEIPDEDDLVDPNDDIAWLLALIRGSKVELWNVRIVLMSNEGGPVTPGEVHSGYLEIMEHEKPIVAAAFSPDGTAVATASLDGEIKFFQVYMLNGNKPRCLHHWQPHGGEPLSSLFFLDNHKNYNPEVQFWKFAITGAKDNSEIKVWSCESWSCLQTLAFQPLDNRPIMLSAGLDLASGYLLLSDFHHKILYVFQLFTNNIESTAAIISVSEFLLPYPILSFGIVDAGLQPFKSSNLEEVCNDKNDEESIVGVFIKMYLVQPKSLQDCQIAFIPPKAGSFDKSNLLSISESPFYIQPPSEIIEEELASNQQELPANHSSLQQLNLMTPDAFNSPIKHETSGSSLKKTQLEETTYSNSTTLVASPHSPDEAENPLLQGGVEISNVLAGYGFASGGSSPSREVQEILSEGKCFFSETDEIQQDLEQVDLTPSKEKTVPTVWPEIPMLKMTDVRKNEEHARRSVNQGESSGGAESELWKSNQRLETSISSMINVMNSLMQAYEEQANEIKQLREEIKQQQLLREVDKVITRNSQQQTLLLENILAAKDNNKQQEASLTTAVTQSVSNFLSTTFLESFINEIPKFIVPTVINQMESLKQQVLIDFSQKLNATDQLLKENITKMVHSESVMKVLSTAVVSSLKPAISQSYKEYFSTVALPSFEESCSALFTQINETFLKGTKEYVATLDTQSSRMSEKNREQSVQLQALSDVVNNNINEMKKELQKSITNIEKQIMDSVTRALTLQQNVLEGSVIAAVQSRAVTPAPHVMDTQTLQKQILQLINQGDVNSAFQQALNASDLSLVVFICEKVNPQQLFSQVPCPLQQHVLLSLVQQLSADMNSHTEIKQKYLEEALMNFDVNNKLTREYLPVVLVDLQKQLHAYISSNPNNRVTRSMRILLMASHSVLGNTSAPPP